MNDLITMVKEQFSSNAFLQGGFILGVISAIVIWGRDSVTRGFRFTYSMFFISITTDSTDMFYQCLQKWIHHEGITKNKRVTQVYINDKTDPPTVSFLAARVSYLTRRTGFWSTITRSVDNDNGDGGNSGSNRVQSGVPSWLRPEKLSITTFIWNRSALHDFVSYIAEEYTGNSGGVEVYSFGWDNWRLNYEIVGVDFDKIILNGNLSEEMSKDLDWFYSSREWFDKRQLPYQKGYLFRGPPGTGKTSLVSALAKKYGLKICMIELAERTDAELKTMFSRAPKNCILCLEDFDSFFNGRKSICKDTKVTFSGLLNAINGISSGVGRLCIITTNDTEKIDPALARAGRLDKHWHIGYLEAEQTSRLLHIYYPDTPTENIWIARFAAAMEGQQVSPADLVGHIQAHHMDTDLNTVLDVKQFIADCKERRKIMTEIREEAKAELEAKEEEDESGIESAGDKGAA